METPENPTPKKKKRNKPLVINISTTELFLRLAQVPKEEIDAKQIEINTKKK